MQEIFQMNVYDASMASKQKQGNHLRKLRIKSGLSLRELARQIDEQHSNVNFWETTDTLPRSNVLLPMAKALGVTVEELLGEPKPRKQAAPGGKLGLVVDRISRMPRRRQQRIIETVETLLTGEEAKL